MLHKNAISMIINVKMPIQYINNVINQTYFAKNGIITFKKTFTNSKLTRTILNASKTANQHYLTQEIFFKYISVIILVH